MASFDYRLNPLFPLKECSSCRALCTMEYCCSDGSLVDKIICDLNKTPGLSQRPPQNCPKCGNPVDGQYCQGCALLRKELKEDENSFTYDSKSNIVDDSPNIFNPPPQPPTYSYEFCGNDAYCGHDCPLQVPFTYDPEPCYNQDFNFPQNFQIFPQQYLCCTHCGDPPKTCQCDQLIFDEPYCKNCRVLSLAWETILEIEHAFEDKHCQPEDILGLFQRLHNDVQNIHEELAAYINTPSWDHPTICYNDDDEDCTIAITPILSNEEPDQFEDFFESNEDSTSIDDYSFSINDIEYVEASPPDSELVSLNVVEIFILEVRGIDIKALKDNPTPSFDFVAKSSSTSLNFLLEETNTFDNSLPESETFCFDSKENSSGSTTTRADISLPDYVAFYDNHIKEISSGSTTTHSDFSLYDSFNFDLSINPFPPADRSDFYEFVDELAQIISPPKYDCFCFKNEPDSGHFTMDGVEDIFPTREPRVHVHNVLPTHPTLQLNLDFILSSESLFAYVVWIFLPFLSYLVAS
uniref:Pre-mRNA splicing Prp18-interacting factor n=1 Tax=Tanacetum cinerariifolium TaxID=118510 RepID=A0A6L2K4J3_TANCI|nr:hypothetical protein [Tanacetum cinerariifolium]